MNDIAIIGGGAAGLICAIAAAEGLSNRITVYERGARVGRKLLATGNGRCNMTNIYADSEHFHGRDVSFIEYAKENFWVSEALDFFDRLGILYKVEDEGRVYPYCDQASAVLDVLRYGAVKRGVVFKTGFEASGIRKKGAKFFLSFYNGVEECADAAVIATGGKAAPDLGSNGSGYKLLKSMGHRITDISPSLVQIRTEGKISGKLKGIKVNAKVTLGKEIKCGEVLFTDYGLSGPPVFYLSAYLKGDDKLLLDIMPEYSFSDVTNLINERIANNPQLELESFFVGMLNKRVAQVLLKDLDIAPLSRRTESLTGQEVKRLASKIKNWEFKAEGTMSWNNAQVTKGGAYTEEFDPQTMQSRLVRGLYAAGEVLDIDGDCGGYNLQWAWSSGYIAGKSMVK